MPILLRPPHRVNNFHLIMTRQKRFEFSTQTSYFLQDDPQTDPETFDYAGPPISDRIRTKVTH